MLLSINAITIRRDEGDRDECFALRFPQSSALPEHVFDMYIKFWADTELAG